MMQYWEQDDLSILKDAIFTVMGTNKEGVSDEANRYYTNLL